MTWILGNGTHAKDTEGDTFTGGVYNKVWNP